MTKSSWTEKLPLVVGVGLPILLIIYVAVYVYLPPLFVKPKYNFIYTTSSPSDFDTRVINGRISVTPRYFDDSRRQLSPDSVNLFLYDVTNDKSQPITLSQAQSYTLDPSSRSPDGFAVDRSRAGGSFFLFYPYGDGGYYLQGRGLNKRVYDQDYNFKFLGWTINE